MISLRFLRGVPVVTLVYVVFYTSITIMTMFMRYQSLEAHRVLKPSINLGDITVPSLQLVPSQMVLHFWVIFISTFVEISIIRFIVGLVILYFGSKYCERSWNYSETLGTNSKVFSETVVFLTLIGIFTNISSVFTKLVIDLITGDVEELTKPLNHGIFSIAMGFIVVLKQLVPEHNIKLFKGLIHIRLRQLPFVILCITLSLSIALRSIEPSIPIFNSFYVSWCYLRYFQVNSISDLLPTTSSESANNNTHIIKGDASDTFAFIQFFPDFMHFMLKPISRFFYHSSVFLKLIRGFNDDDVETGNLRTIKRLNNSSNGVHASVNSVSKEVADRRRQVALKLLEQNNLDKKNSAPSSPNPGN